ncbi:MULTISPECIES: type II toxin-antitoxin system VapB family antitoxin [Pseudomonas]|uniref:type II toxin-antitoxin system VapB family antitoxin n=1 Tax=Pseudomonas TaxID=286 RepID=UPI00123928C6|nr:MULTISPECIES: type II toxin-antitoxin system VapB family antitoxin [Pseudomonas]QIB50077.1 type II toxin-antitoxin system VapB family antitoxin [Pseudomonas sp. OIL-1]
MLIKINIDDALYAKASKLAGPDMGQEDIFHGALEAFIRVQAAKRLAELGGVSPNMSEMPPRR